jgi:4-amino-4-deoxy-L-arabinose transferase-like glycosyltransferase
LNASVRLFGSDRACVLLVLVVALVLCATGLGHRDLWDPDEPRTALATAGILKTGDWSVLRQDGRVWLEKPPLYYWLAAASSLAAGRVDEVTVRLPANGAAVLCALGVFLLGREFWGRRAGTLAALVLLTMEDFVVEARWARPDMLLALLLTVATVCAWGAVQASFGRSWLLGFWGALGLAVLAKGPVGLLPLAGLLVFLAATRRLVSAGRIGAWWGVPVTAAPSLAWLIAWRDETGAAFPVVSEMVRFGQRVAGGLHHPHPPVHLLTTLPLALMPWVVFLPAALLETFPRPGQPHDDRRAFLYSFLIVYVMMFAMSVEKRGIYLLPLLPLVAILIGRLWDLALFHWDPPPAALAVRIGLLCWLAAVIAASAYYLPRIARAGADLDGPARLLASCAFIAALLPIVFWRRLGPGGSMSLFALGTAACILVAILAVMPALDRYKSARGFARQLAGAPADRIGIHPDAHGGLSWYSGRPIDLLPDRTALAAFLTTSPRSLAVVEEDAWIAARRAEPMPGREVGRGSVGHRTFVLVQGTDAGPVPQER